MPLSDRIRARVRERDCFFAIFPDNGFSVLSPMNDKVFPVPGSNNTGNKDIDDGLAELNYNSLATGDAFDFVMSSPKNTCGGLIALKATLPCTAEFGLMWNSRTASTRRSPTKWRGRPKLPAIASNTPKNTVCSVLPEQESITSKTTSPRKERLQNENC